MNDAHLNAGLAASSLAGLRDVDDLAADVQLLVRRRRLLVAHLRQEGSWDTHADEQDLPTCAP